MDNKKQIDLVYNPDKASQKAKVVIGLSGGIDSMVAAYLLKIQKYELYGVVIVPGWEQFRGDKSRTLSCQIDESKLNSINEFCQQLKIPLEVIKASGEFQDKVVEKWMTSRLTGTGLSACWSCHDLKMKTLFQKMQELGAGLLATGHYAKLFHHAAHDTYYVHTSNDEENDQAALLNRLPPEILKSLLLPLSDLQKKEVMKLAENFGMMVRPTQLKMHACFPNNQDTVEYLKNHAPKNFTKNGEMMNGDGTIMYGEHQGIINHPYGEVMTMDGAARRGDLFLAKYNFKDHKITLKPEEGFYQERILLTECSFAEEVSWIEPMKAVIELSGKNLIDCWIYPKCLNSAYIVWEGKHKILAGEITSLYKKRGKNSKVLMTGKVRYLTPPVDEFSGDKEGLEKKVVIDRAKDF